MFVGFIDIFFSWSAFHLFRRLFAFIDRAAGFPGKPAPVGRHLGTGRLFQCFVLAFFTDVLDLGRVHENHTSFSGSGFFSGTGPISWSLWNCLMQSIHFPRISGQDSLYPIGRK
jgi:hypothetical protein